MDMYYFYSQAIATVTARDTKKCSTAECPEKKRQTIWKTTNVFNTEMT